MLELQDPEIFRAVLESVQTGVYLVDREWKIRFWNDGAERITGYLRHDVLGRFCRNNILALCNNQGCVLCAAACPFAQTLRDGQSREVRIQLRHKQGHRVPAHMRIAAIRDLHGSIVGTAESFDALRFASDRDQHQHNLATYGCLDHITSIPNHGFTQFHLRENLASFAAYHLPFAIARIQIDRLKHFQNAYGREAVDGILRVVSETMRSGLRPSDFLGRWTDDQFLAILMDCGVAGMEEAGARMRKVVGCAGLQWWGDELSATISLGYSAAQTRDTIESLLERAQRSLEAKSASCVLAASAGNQGRSKS
jgi:diguanylate cyclase (GGDEF)-like protein/PAS domain S-box-containing protein